MPFDKDNKASSAFALDAPRACAVPACAARLGCTRRGVGSATGSGSCCLRKRQRSWLAARPSCVACCVYAALCAWSAVRRHQQRPARLQLAAPRRCRRQASGRLPVARSLCPAARVRSTVRCAANCAHCCSLRMLAGSRCGDRRDRCGEQAVARRALNTTHPSE